MIGGGLALAFGLCVGWIAHARWQARPSADAVDRAGPYTLLDKIGEGGMGVVFKAHHARLRRPTAVKLLHLSTPDPKLRRELLARFEREATLTSQLSHPNTVVVFDFGQTAGGDLYYAMELIDGVDLQRMVEQDGPLPAGRVVHLMMQACGSLSEAHSHHLIHRDLKPANLLVCTRSGIPDLLKVVDFGLVKDLDAVSISTTSVQVGTPHYVAPELLLHPDQPNGATDIYALGAVMYWLVTGTTVSRGGSGVAAMAEALTRSPDPPSTRVPSVPVDLERVIMRCLERNPFDRPASMPDVASELRACAAYGSWTEAHAHAYWTERAAKHAGVAS